MSPRFVLRYDLRNPPDSGWTSGELYRAMLDQVEYAAARGFCEVAFSEHHVDPWGYLPAPRVLAAAVGARVPHITIAFRLLVLPLHDPLQVAEDIAVLDQLTDGRIKLCVGAGYRAEEFAARGIDFRSRFSRLEEAVAILRLAWRGEEFGFVGRHFRFNRALVRPTPVQTPFPIALAGSSEGAARRAARIADSFVPQGRRRELVDAYNAERRALGQPAGRFQSTQLPLFLHVAKDPDLAWSRIASLALADTRHYAAWDSRRSAGASANSYPDAVEAEALRGVSHDAVTPERARALVEGVLAERDDAEILFSPMLPGLDPEASMESLQLFCDAVADLLQVPETAPGGRADRNGSEGAR